MEQELKEIARKYTMFNQLDILDIEFENKHTLEVFVAYKPKDKANGLAGLSNLPIGGMLFCYPNGSDAKFTMHGMFMDLDIAWYTKDGKLIGSASFNQDHPNEIIPPSTFHYIIEAPKGTLPKGNMKVNKNGR